MTWSRRTLLKTLVVSAAGAVGACGDEAEPVRASTDAGSDGFGDAGSDVGIDAGADVERDAEDDGGDAAPPEQGHAPAEVDVTRFPQSVVSGDPRPGSVVLWTRLEPGAGAGDETVWLELAHDEAFERPVMGAVALVARAEFDHCVKVRVTDLDADTWYFYRFVVETAEGRRSTRIARTRTAPEPDAARPVRFAFVSCQDWVGAYYNPYKRLAEDDIDFLIHLGDYIYETTGDPEFQRVDAARSIVFDDEDGAIALGEGDGAYRAAASLDNYRQLYRTVRTDPALQRVHERFPMIAIWDDHEFTNDSWGAHGTYFNGERSEEDVERRRNANQAWSEFMPVDWADDPDFVYDRAVEPPDDIRIWRDVRWGALVHLVLTDLRSYRPDHIVPEDGHPGSVVIDQDTLEAHHGGVPEWASPYVDLEADAESSEAAEAWCEAEGYPFERLGRFVRVQEVDAMRAAASLPPLEPSEVEALPRGVAWGDCGKTSLYSSLGSRYLTVADAHDRIADERWRTSDGASERLMGDRQRAWFLDTMTTSDARWKVWCNEFCLFSKIVDIRSFGRLPDSLRRRFYLSTEDWAGVPNERDALLDVLADVPNALAITGDIHAFFASTPGVRADPSRRIPELVTSSISSGTYERLLVRRANSDPGLRDAGAAALALLVPDLMQDATSRPNPELAYSRINQNGYAVADVSDAAFTVTFTGFDQALSSRDLSVAEALDSATATEVRVQVRDGAPDLWMERDGVWMRWDMETMQWVG